MSIIRALVRLATGRLVQINDTDELLAPGGLRTRDGDTGGGDVNCRHVRLPEAGQVQIIDSSGTVIGGFGFAGSGLPLVVFTGTHPTGDDPIQVESDGTNVNIPSLTSTTQATSDDSTAIATTEFVHDVIDGLVVPFQAEFGAGSKGGSPIAIGNDEAAGIAGQAFTLGAGWRLWVYPSISSGTFTVDIRKKATGSYPPSGSGDSICGGSPVSITSGVEANGSTSAWTAAVAANSALAATVTANSAGVRWFRLVIPSTRDL